MDTRTIVSNSADISLESISAAKSTNFCTIWPNVKVGLELLRDLVKNPVVKATISIVIAAGDAVSKQVCG